MLRTTLWQPLIRRPLAVPWVRFNHGVSKGRDDNDPKNTPKSDAPNSSTDIDKRAQQSVFQVQPKTSKAAPADYDASSGISKLLRHEKKPYVPKIRHERLSYDYPGLPNQDDFTKHSNKEKKPRRVTRWSRHAPKILTVAVVVWGAYVVKVWFYPAADDSDSNDLLDANHFHKFVVTHKKQVDENHFLVEVRPKHSGWQMSYYAHYDNKSIWNGDVMWSVEIKQPQIMVVRSYTPLPLYFLKSERTRSGEKEPLLKVIENDADDYDKGGVMTFYVKRYDDGEVSRYIADRNVGEELDIRGPHVDLRLPYHPLKAVHERPIFRDLPSKVEPETLLESIRAEHGIPDYDTLDFYGAGTGIAPILQVLLSRNPYRGFVNVHYSAKSGTELQPLKRFMFFLEMLDRARFHEHIDTDCKLTSADIREPAEPKYISPMREEIREGERELKESNELKELKELKESNELKELKELKESNESKELNDSKESNESKELNDSKESNDSKELKESNQKRKVLGDNSNENLRLRMAILNNDTVDSKPRPRVKWYQNALDQAQDTSRVPKTNGALAVVCGPEGYIEYVAGAKDLVSGEQGPVRGLLGDKKWDSTNVVKL